MSAATTGATRRRVEAADRSQSVTQLELFFDLVFVFALTQVTALMAADLSARGLLRGLLVLAVLWWSWVGYAWIGNVVRADEGAARLNLLVAMAAMFVMALAIPEAFDDLPGGLPGPLVVALCYAAFRFLHLSLFWIIAGDDQGLRGQLVRFAPSVLGGTTLLLVAAAFDGATQTALWALALVADYVGTYLGGASGWRLRAPRHFAERHGLILIVALGESIVAIGVGVAQLAITWPIVVAAALGLFVSAALWALYFDVTSLRAEHALADEAEERQAGLARDAYSYLHLPLIAGVVLLALGFKKVLEYVGDGEAHDLGDALTGLGLAALYGGLALYLVALVAFLRRTAGVLDRRRLGVAAAVLVLFPVAWQLPALGAFALLAAVVGGLALVESRRLAEHRYRLHHEQA